MKKTFRMTLLLCLVVAAMLMITACLPKDPVQQTTPEVTTPEATTPEATTPEPTTPPHVHTEEIMNGKAATCTETGLSEGKKCSVCGDILQAQEEIAATGHVFGEWVEIKAPTIKEEGEKTRSCANCEEIETNVLTKLEDPDKPENGVLVESINGKNAGELLEQFAKDFENVESLYWDGAMSTTQDGVTTQEFASIKLCNGELALLLEKDGAFNSVYFVDGILYINTDGVKIKVPAGSIEEALGEEAIDDLISEMNVSFSQAEIEAAANANIYFENTRNKYLVTIHTTNEESGLEEETKFYFNADGKLTDAHSTSDEGYVMLSIHSYNEPVLIELPADADEYKLPGMIEVEIPEGSVAVDTVNGMTSLELLQKYFADFASSTTFDIDVTLVQTVDGEEVTIREIVKLGEDSIYVYVEMLGEVTEMWYVDGVAYMRYGEYKVKEENSSYEEFLGEGFLEGIFSALIRDMPEFYFAYVAESQLYELDGEYFFTVGFSMPEEGMTSYIESLHFDENGRVTATFTYVTDAEGNDYSIIGIYNSYGEPVVVLPPEDADEYLTEEEIDPEDPETPEAPELPETEEDIYALYTEMCTTLQGATHYVMDLYVNDEYVANYAIANGDLYLGRLNNGNLIEQWLIGGVGYSAINYGTPNQTEVDATFWETVFNFEDILPIGVISQDVMSNLRCTYDEYYGEVIVWFDIVEDNGDMVQCKYALFEWEGYSPYIEVIHTFIEGGEVVQEDYFFFDYINDPSVEITLPEA